MCLTAIRASARPMARERAAPTTSHFGCACYHPLFVFNHLGDVEQRALRPSNVHSADAACGARTGSGPLSAHCGATQLPGRRSLGQSRDLRIPGSQRDRLNDRLAGHQRATAVQWSEEGKTCFQVYAALMPDLRRQRGCVSSSMRWPAISATSCERWRCRGRRSGGR
jgi:hypothetical protein